MSEEGITFTVGEVERAMHDVAFLVEKLKLSLDHLQISDMQESLHRALVDHSNEQGNVDKNTILLDSQEVASLISQTPSSPRNAPDPFADLLLNWLTQPSYREARRILEAHPELLDEKAEKLLQNFIRSVQEHEPKIQRDLIQTLNNHKELLYDIRKRGSTIEAIRQAYVNMYGGFVLDMPPWLEEIEHRISSLPHREASKTVGQEYMSLFEVCLRARKDAEIAPEVLAELHILLLRHSEISSDIQRYYAQKEQIIDPTVALHIYTRERYPLQYAQVQFLQGAFYQGRRVGDQSMNLEAAIVCYRQALEADKSGSAPQLRALTLINLGVVYGQRMVGERSANQEEAIACYQDALEIFVPESYPIEYARTLLNLGVAYSQRIAGEPVTNLEKALTCYDRALKILKRETFPVDYAYAQMSLGVAYSRMEGERRANQREAIACYQRALEIFSPQRSPFDYACTLANLGKILAERMEGERSTNQEEAIVCYQRALEIFTPEAFPEDYAYVQLSLGMLYLQRIGDERRNNQEEAIACYRRALEIFTPEKFPDKYAQTQLNLGTAYLERLVGGKAINREFAILSYKSALEIFSLASSHRARTLLMLGAAYSQRIEGDRRTNLEEAINSYKEASTIFTYDAYPEEYAVAQYNLGNIYRRRLSGTPRDNLEEAITSYENALKVFGLTYFPEQYAAIQNNLGNVYVERVAGKREESQEKAIQCYKEALKIYTFKGFPVDYAHAQNNLGNAYAGRSAGEGDMHLRKAITAYKNALKVFTTQTFPNDYRRTQLSLALAEAKRQDWTQVHRAYRHALIAEDALFALSVDASSRSSIVKEGGDAAIRDAFALVRLSRIKEAALVMERGCARRSMMFQMLDNADPARIHDVQLRKRYEDTCENFIAAQAIWNAPHRLRLDSEPVPTGPLTMRPRRAIEEERTKAYQRAKSEFLDVVQKVREAEGTADFLDTTLDPQKIIYSVAAKKEPGHALTYLAATPWGGIAIAIFKSGPRKQKPCFSALDLPELTHEFVTNLLESRLDIGERSVIIGGFIHAQHGNGFSLLSQDWEGKTFRARAEALQIACQKVERIDTLNKAAQELLNHSRLEPIIDQPFDELSPHEHDMLAGTLDRLFLQYELEHVLNTLSSSVFNSLVRWLCQQGIHAITLIPCSQLAALPLLAALQQTVSDFLVASVAPSAHSLLRSQGSPPSRQGVYAMGASRLSRHSRLWSEAQARTLAMLARRQGLVAEVGVQQSATRQWLLGALCEGLVVDASCRCIFSNRDPLQSTFSMASAERISPRDIQRGNLNLQGLRLLIISTCTTAGIGAEETYDEIQDFTAFLLHAGTQAILTSLWSQRELAAYLLIVRFAQEWFPSMSTESPAVALERAQRWLRSVTNADLLAWRATTFPNTSPDKPQELPDSLELKTPFSGSATNTSLLNALDDIDVNALELLVRARASRSSDPQACPYANPIYWAGFQIIGW